MFLKIFAVALLLIVSILVFAATRPNTFQVERSITIQAPPEKVFALLNDFHHWPQWAPQDKEDSTIKRSYSGPASGVGATSEWSGTGNTGKGRLTITNSVPPTSLTVQADWARPFAARNINQFTLAPDGGSTRVTWRMHGPNLYMMKLMSLFTNMDRVMGRHFESGLENLKTVCEH